MKTYTFNCFVLNGFGEVASLASWNRRVENNFVSVHDNLSQFGVLFSIKFDEEGVILPGFYEVKVLQASSLKDAIRQIHVALKINFAKAYFIPRYECLSSNDFDCRGSIRYLSKPVEKYL